MNNIEKAIEYWQSLLKSFEDKPDDTYWGREHKKLSREMVGLAVSALEKQIPKKVVESDETYCLNCNAKILTYYKTTNYCLNCGQALDWGETKCHIEGGGGTG